MSIKTLPAVRTITIHIPGCPDPALSPNARPHWRKRAAAVKEARSHAHWAALEARWDFLGMMLGGAIFDGPVRLKATIGWGKGRKGMDQQNAIASLKPHVDGLQDAAIIANDSQVRSIEIEQVRDKAGIGYVELVIQEATA